MAQQSKDCYSEDFRYSFDYFWEKVIYPTILAADEEVDKDFKRACDFQFAYNDIEKYKRDLMDFYHEKRQWLKGVYLPHDEHPLLDMHKLGAILCRSMLAYKPFYFNFKAAEKFVIDKFSGDRRNHIDWFVNNIYLNYKVAFYVSTGLIYIELLYSYSPRGGRADIDAMKYFLDLGGLVYYEKSESHDSYENSCIIALQKNDVLRRDFDYLAYAANLFQLESFNRMVYELSLHSTPAVT